jgi:hypothetical protein
MGGRVGERAVVSGRTTDEEEATLIRQVWLYAKFHAADCCYKDIGETEAALFQLSTRPYFVIDTAMRGCGYQPMGADWKQWNVVKRWMYGADANLRTGPNGAMRKGHA